MKKYFLIIVALCVITPAIAFAAWWNPFTWNWNPLTWFNYWGKGQINIEQKNESPEKDTGQKESYAGDAVLIILDASGSMGEKLGSDTKIDIAKQAIEKVVNDMPDDSIVGLRVYGSEGTYEEHNCKDTELLFPISKLDKVAYILKAKSFKPSGWTPIDYVLRISRDDFANYQGAKKKIILISDGKETCGGNPCDAIKELKNSGFDVTVDTIGFNVDAIARQQLKCISSASGGLYFDAVNTEQLEQALRLTIPKVPEPPKVIVPKVPEPPHLEW